MRNVDMMIRLLEEMSKDPGGQILLVSTLAMSNQSLARRHQADLLNDAGLAIWKSESAIRITNGGYDFLNAINQDRPQYVAKCKELLGKGMTLVNVAKDIISIVNAARQAG